MTTTPDAPVGTAEGVRVLSPRGPRSLSARLPSPYLFTRGEAVCFADPDDESEAPRRGVVVADAGGLRILLRDDAGRSWALAPGYVWNEASVAHHLAEQARTAIPRR